MNILKIFKLPFIIDNIIARTIVEIHPDGKDILWNYAPKEKRTDYNTMDIKIGMYSGIAVFESIFWLFGFVLAVIFMLDHLKVTLIVLSLLAVNQLTLHSSFIKRFFIALFKNIKENS